MKITRLDDGGIEIYTPAKVNLYLEVLGKRPDGYHEIESVMEPVTFYDRMIIHPAAGEPAIECDSKDVPADESNTVLKAWRALKKRKPALPAIKVRLFKEIPSGAGLGGGSSNAAGALMAMNELFSLEMSRNELAEVGAEVGSDVPFFFAGGRALVGGRGEKYALLQKCTILYHIIILSGITCSTEKIYKNLNSGLTGKKQNDILIKMGTVDKAGDALYNRLEESAFRLFPQLALLKKRLIAMHSGGVVMSGSGSSIICVCRTFEEAAQLKSEIEAAGLARCVAAHTAAY